MFLHSGAGLHGHEYSSRPSQSAQLPSPTRHPLLRSTLRPLSPSDPSPSAQSPTLRDLPRPRPRPSSLVNDRPRPSSLSSRQRADVGVGGLAKKDLAVRFREPHMHEAQAHGGQPQTPTQSQTPLVDEDEESVAGSDLSDCTDLSPRRSKRKRAPRRSSCFVLAHPAPQLRTKQRRLVQIRPRLLLQLQQVGDRRAIPAFDVVPSSLVAGTIIIPQLAKRFPRMFRAKPELGQDDVLVVRSDDYGPSTPDASPRLGQADDGIDDRDVMAVISALPYQGGSCAEIVFEDGSAWTASSMADGSFEFTHVNDQGYTTIARWVRRSLASTRNSTTSIGSSSAPTSPECKWTFSVIDPSSRRHPILGSLTPESVQVYDTYNTLSASSGRFPPTQSFGPEVSGREEAASLSAPRKEERATVAVTLEQKRLMLATAAWINLHQQGWPASANPKFARPVSHSRCVSLGTPDRRQTFPAYGRDGTRAANLQDAWPQSPESYSDSPVIKNHSAAVPARAMSTGRAFMKRRVGRWGETGTAVVAGLEGLSPQEGFESQTKEQQADKTRTCRPKARNWIQKLFHRKRYPGKQGDLLKYKLEE